MITMARRRRRWLLVCAAAWLWGAPIGTAEAHQGALPCERPVLTLTEAAALLRIDESVLERVAANGDVPGQRIGATWRFGCTALMTWLNGRGRDGTTNLADIKARGTAIDAADGSVGPGTASDGDHQESPIGDAPQERTAEDVFLRGQRVLLGPGDVVVDVGQFLARRDDLLLTSAGGVVGLATLEQRALTTVLVGRVGLFTETELFAGTSYSTQHSRQFIGEVTLDRTDRAAFGATTIGVRHTFLREGVGRPDAIVTLSGQVPTEELPAAAGAGVVVIKSVDPVVLFANANYFRAFRKESGELAARFRSADVVDLAMGYGLGLNDTVAISMAVSGAFARTTTLEGVTSRRPSIFGVRFGLTAWLAQGLYIEPSVSFGLTGPGDTVTLGVTLPYAF
jgi:excisionase family DNA binding protein